MTYHLIVPPDLRRDIMRQPLDTQRTLFQLLQAIRDDPDGATVAYGEDVPDSLIRMRTGARGNVITIVIINDHTITVTLVDYAAA
ncbi:hypothetical protein AB0E62_34280 [Streptomyces sp. NPDC038707]|uniref:hypothetical protein n=1 Tax=Streptomyces sp. NPDC038707 TaxID=3154329 RepID=UPI0033F16124